MASNPIISVSGLRGIIGDSLDPVITSKYTAAFASTLPVGSVVISRDGRGSGRMLADVCRATFQACGFSVFDADIAATPTTGVLVRQTKSVGGIQISASHNPPEYNGIKLFGADGRVISASSGQLVLDKYRDQNFAWSPLSKLQSWSNVEDTTSEHLKKVLATVQVDRIRERRFRVLIDCNHGAGSILAKRLLTELNCEVHWLGDKPDGQFEHTPEPTAENLVSISEIAKNGKFDVVFCQDPDADRLALLDETGFYVGEEYTLAVTLSHALKTRRGPVVTNCSTSRMSQDLAEAAGVPFSVSAVGEANVTDEMIRVGAVYGGEGNGGPIDPQVGYVRDSFVGMAQVLDSLAESKLSLSAIVQKLPRYEIYKSKLGLSREAVTKALAALEKAFADAKPNRMDGLRLDFPTAWLLIRASNTEPIVRIIAEAKSMSDAKGLGDRAAAVMAAATQI